MRFVHIYDVLIAKHDSIPYSHLLDKLNNQKQFVQKNSEFVGVISGKSETTNFDLGDPNLQDSKIVKSRLKFREKHLLLPNEVLKTQCSLGLR